MFKLLSCKMFVLCCHFIFFCYLLTFFLFGSTENSKKKVQYEFDCYLIFISVWMNRYLFLYFLSMHLLNFMLWVCVLCFNNLRWLYGSILLFHDLPKRGSAKILARSSISSESKIKVHFKATALDRGYFKVHFFKKKKFSNNLVPYISLNS